VLVEPTLNGFQNVLMLPSRDPSLLGGSAAMLDGAALTDVGQIATQDQSVHRDELFRSAAPKSLLLKPIL
jgi:hypothetical protein